MTGRSMDAASSGHRPRVICHMASSIDGRIVVDEWPEAVAAALHREYEQVHRAYDADGWICGRVTMEPFAGAVRTEAEVEREHTGAPRADHRAPGDHRSFAFAIDPSGRLAWQSNDIDGDHVVAVLSERVSDDYLAVLRARGSPTCSPVRARSTSGWRWIASASASACAR